MKLDEIKISKAIIESYNKKLIDALDVDVAIVGQALPVWSVVIIWLKRARKQCFLKESFLWAEGCGEAG